VAKPVSVHAGSRPAGPVPAEVPVVGGREPCPCGSGRRYKACHGRTRGRLPVQPARRPFEGLRYECDLVALREFVPAATAPLPLSAALARQYEGRTVTLATLLPMAVPAMSRPDGSVLVAVQVADPAPDPSRQIATALQAGLAADPGSEVTVPEPTLDGPRMQDLLDPQGRLDVTVHDGFGFWAEAGEELTPDVAAALERANEAAPPVARLASVTAAYWTRERDRAFLRWVLPHDERPLLDALARLHAARQDGLGDGTRYVGSFRALGLLIPVWELPAEGSVEDYEDPAADFAERLEAALATSSPLTDAERRARDGLLSRQLTIR
jgi:hypothetical protein